MKFMGREMTGAVHRLLNVSYTRFSDIVECRSISSFLYHSVKKFVCCVIVTCSALMDDVLVFVFGIINYKV